VLVSGSLLIALRPPPFTSPAAKRKRVKGVVRHHDNRVTAMNEWISQIEWQDILRQTITLLIAYVLALPIGWNREKAERSAGLRTFPLVAVSCCGFVQAAEGRLGEDVGAMGAVVEGLITGIGFIGGGAILKLQNSVKGTATAASLWGTGAIGAAVGLGAYEVAIVIAFLTKATLAFLPHLKPAEHERATEDDPTARDDP